MTELHPKFVEAMTELEKFSMEDRINRTHPDIDGLYTQAIRYAPKEMQDMMTAKMQELNLLPDATRVDANGNPVYSVDQMAKQFGMTPEEVMEHIDSLTPEERAAFTMPTSDTHRIH